MESDTDRSLLILVENTKYLLAPKANLLSITDAYIKLKEYCQHHKLTGGMLYYTDNNQRIKLLSYEINEEHNTQENS